MNMETFFECNKGQYNESHVLKILAKLMRSLEFIHSAGILHRDIKPSNILINNNFDVLLCDFGLARSTREENSLNSRIGEGINKEEAEIARALSHDKQDRRHR